MSNTITVKMLESRVKYLNKITNSPETSYTRSGDKITANIGNHYLDGAYSGYTVDRMCNESGGVTEIFSGHMPKRDLYNKLNAYISGIEEGKRLQDEHVNIHTTFGDLQELAKIEDFETQNNLEKLNQ
jgi:hypothetical protein